MFSICIKEMWERTGIKRVTSLAIAEGGTIGVGSAQGCIFVSRPDGELLTKTCTNSSIVSASAYENILAFLNKEGEVLLFNRYGEELGKLKIDDPEVIGKIAVGREGFVACKRKCALFDFNGEIKWIFPTFAGSVRPAYLDGMWVLPEKILGYAYIVESESGNAVGRLYIGNSLTDIAVSGKTVVLADSAGVHVFSFSGNKPKAIASFSTVPVLSVGVGPNGKYVAVASGSRFLIYALNGRSVYRQRSSQGISQFREVAWDGNLLAVGGVRFLGVLRTAPVLVLFPAFASTN